MKNLAFLYENLPADYKLRTSEMLEFLAFQGHFVMPRNAVFIEILPLLSEKLTQDLADYLAFLDTKIEKEISPEEKAEKALSLAKRLVLNLQKMPAESLENLRNELKKMIPQPDSTVMLKLGSGAYPEERETSVGIFVAIQSVRTTEETLDFQHFFENVFRLAQNKPFELLDSVLSEFESESEPEYWLTSIPASKMYEGLYGLHFSLKGRLNLSNVENEGE